MIHDICVCICGNHILTMKFNIANDASKFKSSPAIFWCEEVENVRGEK